MKNTYTRLFKKMSDYSNCYFPITDFLNDISRNNDKNYNKERAYEDLEKIFDTCMEYRNKAEKYEKLEEKLGFPLDVYIKLKEREEFYVLRHGELRKEYITKFHKGSVEYIECDDYCEFYPHFIYAKNYKIDWWLKADQSE